ncbi:Hypothetical predicted protein [Mytilus galloprovincialis]|uniref:Uncharacterized protein n=1 Tax=Mytilus galloprovincialis TaxID=29158 RepID=A0A8B6G183_MYTGA|nr:Hypothetical predicted protein [Mytilus galloprovincialis]
MTFGKTNTVNNHFASLSNFGIKQLTLSILVSSYCKGKEVSYNHYNVLHGDDITLHHITSELGNTKTKNIQWKKNGHQLQECGTFGRQSGGTTPSLTISRIEICDLGTYASCLDSDPTRCTHHDIGVVVFRGASGDLGGQNNIFDLWSSKHTANTNVTYAMRTGSMSGLHYKSELVEKWSDLKLQKVKLAVYQGGVEKIFFIFDARETDKMSWMNKDRLISTSYDDYDDLIGDGGNAKYFSMTGLIRSYVRRRFFLNKYKKANSCSDMGGWLSVTELGLCPWENEMKYPGIYFSPGNTQTNWNHAEKADELTISLVLNISEVTSCHCSCSDIRRQADKFLASLYGYSKFELEQILEPILLKTKDELKLNKTKLSSYKRKRNSAQDSRKSSKQIGIIGVIFIGVVISLVILIDVVEIRQRLVDINIFI